MEQLFANLYPSGVVQVIELKTVGKSGRGFDRTVQTIRARVDNREHALIRVIDPEELRGTGVLMLERGELERSFHIYLPGGRIVRRMQAFQKSDPFLGTDLSYEDVEAKDPKNFHAVIRAESGSCTEIEIVPRASARSQYSRLLACVGARTGVPHSMRMFRGNEVVRRLEIEVERLHQVDGRYVPRMMRMLNVASGSETVIHTRSTRNISALPSDTFSLRNLETGSAKRDRLRVLELDPPGM